IGEPLARFGWPAARQSVGEHDGINRTGRGAGNAFDLKPAVVEQMVEHAPGEGAERAAALQRQIDALLGFGRAVLVAAESAREEFDHRLLRDPAAVDRLRRAGNGTRLVTAQEYDKRADGLRSRELMHWLLLRQHRAPGIVGAEILSLGTGVELLLDQRRQYPARADGVAGDAGIGGLDRHHFG